MVNSDRGILITMTPTKLSGWTLFLLTPFFCSCSLTTSGSRIQDGPPTGKATAIASSEILTVRQEPRSKKGNPPFYRVLGKRYYVLESSEGYQQEGIASWYGTKFHGQPTSSGEIYDMYAMSAAHKTLPLPTFARVSRLDGTGSVIVRVNDRGPFVKDRLIDLSYGAAQKLGITESGTAPVKVTALTPEASPKLSSSTSPIDPLAALDNDAMKVFYLQVGAFSQRGNAQQLRSNLSPLTENNIEIQEGTLLSQTIYRVRIGPIANLEKAYQLADRLDNYGLSDYQVVYDQ